MFLGSGKPKRSETKNLSGRISDNHFFNTQSLISSTGRASFAPRHVSGGRWGHLPDRVPAPARLQEITRCVTIRCHRGPMANEAANHSRRQTVSLNKPVRGSVCLKSVRFAGGQPSGLEIGGELCCMETTMKPLTLLLV